MKVHFNQINLTALSTLENVDTNIWDELSQVPKRESTKSEKDIEIPDYTLYALEKLEGLSVQTIKVCKRYHLNNLTKILHYFYIERKEFKHLLNCGSQSVDELEGVCEKYGNFIINPISIH